VRTARSRRPGGTALRLAAIGVATFGGCGSPGQPTPSPSPSPSGPTLGGTVEGAYVLQIVPAESCSMSRAPLTFDMNAAAAGTSPHPGVQVLLDPNGFQLEMELLSGSFTLRGGVGTFEPGLIRADGSRVFVRGIAFGTVQRSAGGRGEIAAGTIAGYLALAAPNDFEGSLGTCVATNHAFSLRTR
jgi:hypothetical protein